MKSELEEQALDGASATDSQNVPDWPTQGSASSAVIGRHPDFKDA